MVTKIVKDTEGYSYFIQFYCKEIINSINKKNITTKDYKLIKSSITQQLEYDFFDPRMDMLSDDEKIVLKFMSKITDRDILFKDIERKSKMDKRKLSKYLQRSEKKVLCTTTCMEFIAFRFQCLESIYRVNSRQKVPTMLLTL